YKPTERFSQSLMDSQQLTSFGVVVPLLDSKQVLRGTVQGHPDVELGFITRTRRNMGKSESLRPGFPGSSGRQRPATERIAMLPDAKERGGGLAGGHATDGSGGRLLSFCGDFKEEENRLRDYQSGTALLTKDITDRH